MKTLALVHGWGATGASWECLRESLGGSWRVEAPTLPEWRAEWLAQWLSSLPLPQTLAVGWSLGGVLLMEAVARWHLRPGALVLMAVPAVFCRRPDFPWGQPPGVVRAMRRALAQDPDRVLADFARRCLAPGEESFEAEVRRLFAAEQSPAHLAAGLDYLLATDLRPWLGEISVPVTLVQGEEDAIVPPSQAAFLKDHLPLAELMLLPGAGHVPFLTQKAIVRQMLTDLGGVL